MTERLSDTGLPDDSIGGLFARAVTDVEQVARAEFELQKARALAKMGAARTGLVLLVGAILSGSLAFTGLVVGALLILQRALGPAWATVIVVGTLVVLGGVLGWLALREFATAFGAPKDNR